MYLLGCDSEELLNAVVKKCSPILNHYYRMYYFTFCMQPGVLRYTGHSLEICSTYEEDYIVSKLKCMLDTIESIHTLLYMEKMLLQDTHLFGFCLDNVDNLSKVNYPTINWNVSNTTHLVFSTPLHKLETSDRYNFNYHILYLASQGILYMSLSQVYKTEKEKISILNSFFQVPNRYKKKIKYLIYVCLYYSQVDALKKIKIDNVEFKKMLWFVVQSLKIGANLHKNTMTSFKASTHKIKPIYSSLLHSLMLALSFTSSVINASE